jgi:hypothetical protein
MRDAGRYPAAERERVPYCTNDCLYRHATHRKQKPQPRIIRSVKFHACGPNPRSKSHDTKNALRE